MSLIKRASSIALCFLLLSGCVTTSQQNQIKLPEGLKAYFAPCKSANGAMAMRIYEEDDLRLTSEVEWMSTNAGYWKIEMISPMGQILAGIRYKKNGVFGSQYIADKMPKIILRQDGFLDVDDNLLGIKPSEVSCILKSKLPINWIPELYSFEGRGDQVALNFADGTRAIEVVLNKSQESSANNCVTIKWGHYLGLVTSELDWCFSKNKAAISGIGDLKLNWVNLDE